MHMIEIESEPELQVEQVTFEDVTNSFLEQGKPIASHHNPCFFILNRYFILRFGCALSL
jgi:hypothetical protein